MINNNEAIITIFEGDTTGIAIDPLYCENEIGRIQKINYPNFRYIGKKTIKNYETDNEKEVWFIEIYNIPKNMIIEIKNTITNIVNNSSLSIVEALDEIFEYFKKVKYQKDFARKLLGDIGEAIFILKSLEKGYDFIPYMRNIDEDIYDFQKDDLYFEIKSSSLEKNEFIITHEQLQQISNKKIIICKFKKVPGKTNILDIYKMINNIRPLNDLLILKKEYWENEQNRLLEAKQSDLISNYSVIIDNCKLSLFNEKLLPKVDVIDFKACKKIEYYINCTDSETTDIDEFYNEFIKIINN